jgi:hypothetical protein
MLSAMRISLKQFFISRLEEEKTSFMIDQLGRMFQNSLLLDQTARNLLNSPRIAFVKIKIKLNDNSM